MFKSSSSMRRKQLVEEYSKIYGDSGEPVDNKILTTVLKVTTAHFSLQEHSQEHIKPTKWTREHESKYGCHLTRESSLFCCLSLIAAYQYSSSSKTILCCNQKDD